MTNPAHIIRILIIDDDQDFADSQARDLKDQGYETATAYTVESARDYLECKASEVNIALIDMYMGRDRGAGTKLVDLLSERYPSIVSIVVTGHGDFDNAIKCMQAGAFSYIMKGTSPQGLITETVKKAVERFRLGMIRPSVSGIRDAAEEIERKVHCIEEMLLRITDEGAVESHGRPVTQADKK
jgi:two-component system response regulator YesN